MHIEHRRGHPTCGVVPAMPHSADAVLPAVARLKVVTSEFKKFYVTISCHVSAPPGAGQVVLKSSSPHANLVPIPTRHNQLVLSV